MYIFEQGNKPLSNCDRIYDGKTYQVKKDFRAVIRVRTDGTCVYDSFFKNALIQSYELIKRDFLLAKEKKFISQF